MCIYSPNILYIKNDAFARNTTQNGTVLEMFENLILHGHWAKIYDEQDATGKIESIECSKIIVIAIVNAVHFVLENT